jgi:predicted transporter
MDLNIILWIGGVLFSLGIFAVKVGFGLGFGRIRWKGVFLTLSLYIVLFVLIATLSEQLINILEPLLRKGPYIHALIAAGMIAWGLFTISGSRSVSKNREEQNSEGRSLTPSLLLIIPCPVCLTAMTFSTWAALSVIKLPAAFVGLGLGITFAVLSLLFFAFTKLKDSERPEAALGLSMMAIGIYFIASLFLPAKIEEARGMYQSFLTEGSNIALNNGIGVFALLFVALVIGYLTNKKREVKQ